MGDGLGHWLRLREPADVHSRAASLVFDIADSLAGHDPMRLLDLATGTGSNIRYLAERREKVVHREELLKEVWGYVDTNVTTRSVDHAIVRLRKKIEPDPHHPEFIRTVHGDGYCLSAAQVD